jgi:hypothetical protein
MVNKYPSDCSQFSSSVEKDAVVCLAAVLRSIEAFHSIVSVHFVNLEILQPADSLTRPEKCFSHQNVVFVFLVNIICYVFHRHVY